MSNGKKCSRPDGSTYSEGEKQKHMIDAASRTVHQNERDALLFTKIFKMTQRFPLCSCCCSAAAPRGVSQAFQNPKNTRTTPQPHKHCQQTLYPRDFPLKFKNIFIKQIK